MTVQLDRWDNAVTGEVGETTICLSDDFPDQVLALNTAERLARLLLRAVAAGRR